MRYQYIAYVSAAVKPLTAEEMDTLLLSAREFNSKVGVTGVLLCHKTTFFQFFEGPPESVAKVYQRILNAKQHTHIMELTNQFSEKRFFDTWSMGFCCLPKTQIQTLMHAAWETQLPVVEQYAKASSGLKMLQEFWTRLQFLNVA